MPEYLMKEACYVAMPQVYADKGKLTEAQIQGYYDRLSRAGNRQALLDFVDCVMRDGLLDWNPLKRRPIYSQLRLIKVPTFILWGASDNWLPARVGVDLRRCIAHSALCVYSDLGHIPHEEDPLRTVNDVHLWLTGHLAEISGSSVLGQYTPSKKPLKHHAIQYVQVAKARL
eukprot:gb/GEZN01015117.1/.p1 GENE.gb/GEZN01015117.1/~~gb/GEZN01015117.1/.p1  ORF type:complete len:172 (-),score=19.85 gb/GEZN01015117.1/:131-646(-)